MLSDLSLLLLLILSGAIVSSKPIDEVSLNELDTGTQGDYKKAKDESDVTEIVEIPRPFSKSSNEKLTSIEKGISTVTSSTASPSIREEEIGSERLLEPGNSTADNFSTRQQGLAWFLSPFTQKVQFSPQTFFQDRIGQIKDTLSHIGSIFPNQQDGGLSKQFANGGLLNLVGLNDSGFYTNRLEPAGFFGGNGWLANKGGILGGPGAFISTGSLFTDYPTAYKK